MKFSSWLRIHFSLPCPVQMHAATSIIRDGSVGCSLMNAEPFEMISTESLMH